MLTDDTSQIVVPVLGMHRSGTSMLTNMLNLMGVELGEPLQPPGFDNPKGFWENRFFQALNIKILQLAGCNVNGFDNHQKLKKTCRSFRGKPCSQQELDLVQRYVSTSFKDVHWGWKDPRNAITWPFWKQCLQQLGFNDIRPVVVLRHPDSCTASLIKRGDFTDLVLPEKQTLDDFIADLWKAYYQLIDSYVSAEAIVLLQEDLLNPDTAAREMARCAEYLDLPTVGLGPALAMIDLDLVSHNKRDPDTFKNPKTRSIYDGFRQRSLTQQKTFRGGPGKSDSAVSGFPA